MPYAKTLALLLTVVSLNATAQKAGAAIERVSRDVPPAVLELLMDDWQINGELRRVKAVMDACGRTTLQNALAEKIKKSWSAVRTATAIRQVSREANKLECASCKLASAEENDRALAIVDGVLFGEQEGLVLGVSLAFASADVKRGICSAGEAEAVRLLKRG